MRTRLCLLLLVASCAAHAATYTVTSTGDAAKGSLRWAISMANSHVGADTITFAPALTGRTIVPTSPLPAITGARTTVDGDLDSDGTPDICINGAVVADGDGLVIQGNRALVVGLSITNFANGIGLHLLEVTDCRVRSCHLGVMLDGTTEARNACQLMLDRSHRNRIGGATAAGRNVIAGGTSTGNGLTLSLSDENTIVGNHIGVTRNGWATLAAPTWGRYPFGLALLTSQRNTLGGTTAAERNLIGGVTAVVLTDGSNENVVRGNYLGLGIDGSVLLNMNSGLIIASSSLNTVGGSALGAGNVFAGDADFGVKIEGSSGRSEIAEGNVIAGNYFGTNAEGSAHRRLKAGVVVDRTYGWPVPGAQTIGGGSPASGNWFCPRFVGGEARGVVLDEAGDGSVIRNNVFGVFPHKGTTNTPRTMASGVTVNDVSARIVGNSLWRAERGIEVQGYSSAATILGNYFRDCQNAVDLADASVARLGNLSNASAADDGGNQFVNISQYFIYNYTGADTRAEGNDFGTTSAAAIGAKIHDRNDNPALGLVDFDPLAGGVHPTGAGSPSLTVAGVSAAPTAAGAQLTFTLSAPANVSVTVTNVAGRRVKAVCVERACSAGLNTLLWDGRTDAGLAAPAGAYIVQVQARAVNGAAARTLAPLRLGR
ncbi:MAG: hypothetical protein FJX75_25190 [Armatimonadetes bacterium]|nr:hypothetical protein [Armatimonadota bacterium]